MLREQVQVPLAVRDFVTAINDMRLRDHVTCCDMRAHNQLSTVHYLNVFVFLILRAPKTVTSLADIEAVTKMLPIAQ
jgi:hypothetical protein